MGPKSYCEGKVIDGTQHESAIPQLDSLVSFISSGLACLRALLPTSARSVKGVRRKEAKSPRSGDRLGAIGDFEFAEDITDMMLNGAGCDHQGVRNLLVRGTTREQAEHVLFTRA